MRRKARPPSSRSASPSGRDARQLVAHGAVDFLVFDYLAELAMSILAAARGKDAQPGYATDFVQVKMRAILPDIAARGIRVISNAGGVNPATGAHGLPPGPQYKVPATFMDGFRCTAQLTIVGLDAARKAQRTGEAILARIGELIAHKGWPPYGRTRIEVPGSERRSTGQGNGAGAAGVAGDGARRSAGAGSVGCGRLATPAKQRWGPASRKPRPTKPRIPLRTPRAGGPRNTAPPAAPAVTKAGSHRSHRRRSPAAATPAAPAPAGAGPGARPR